MKFFSTLLSILFLLPLTAQAVGLSVSPAKVDIFYPDVLGQKIKIQNISNEPIKIYVRADDFSKELSLTPAEFDLAPQEIGLVTISGDFEHFSSGVRKTNISVLSQALDKKSFNAISGIKVPVSIYITDSYFKWSGPAVFVLVFLGLGIILILAYLLLNVFRFRPKKNKFAGLNFLLHHKKKWYKWW